MAIVGKTTMLREMRESFTPRLSQEDMARRAGVVLQTYRNAEEGKRVYFATALAIWNAFNEARHQRGLNEVRLEELGMR